MKRVVVVAGEVVKMGETLEQAIKAVFGKGSPTGGGRPAGCGDGQRVRADRGSAAALRRGHQALRAGDLATYDREANAAQVAIEQANAVEPFARTQSDLVRAERARLW